VASKASKSLGSVLDQVLIRDLLVRGVIGIHDWERKARQDVLVNITASCDTRPAAKSDSIVDAVDYRAMTKRVIEHVEKGSPKLVERLAAEIADLCLADPRIQHVRVRVEKPAQCVSRPRWGSRSSGRGAPRSGDVAERCVVLLGSNIEAERNLPAAVEALARHCRVVSVSSVWKSAAIGASGAPDFLNAAVVLETELEPLALRESVLRRIESDLGRVRTADKNAPRTIDLDLVLFGARRVEDPRAGPVLPDPSLLDVAYAAVPVAEAIGADSWSGVPSSLASVAQAHLSAGGIAKVPAIDLHAAAARGSRRARPS
jgi:2-amino-4-hydroxy-6-hydroxymethyldihydropteridine diphosphokinase